MLEERVRDRDHQATIPFSSLADVSLNKAPISCAYASAVSLFTTRDSSKSVLFPTIAMTFFIVRMLVGIGDICLKASIVPMLSVPELSCSSRRMRGGS